MKIHLRKRVGQLSAENEKKGKKRMSSLYLTFKQNPQAKTQYEWLKLQVYENPKTNLEKEHNKETLALAEAIRAKKLIDMQTTANGFVSSVKGKISFLAYFKKLTDKKSEDSNGNYGNWHSTYMHLVTYCNKTDPTLAQIDDLFLEGFKDYLSKNVMKRGAGKLNPNSAQSYFNKVRAAIREAFRNKMIKSNPFDIVRGVKGQDTSRQYLTLQELQQLAKTGCDNHLMKKAFLFSSLTGLRWSDVKNLSWDKIKHDTVDGYRIEYTQQKTKKMEVLPVSVQAINLLYDIKSDDSNQPIFKNLKYHTWMNQQLQDWVDRAGINKKITFHCARHSFATLQLTMDTDIYTVSKLLGHKHLKTTEIYAKVVDQKKVDAAGRIPILS